MFKFVSRPSTKFVNRKYVTLYSRKFFSRKSNCEQGEISADLAVIGSGPGGLYAAIRASENGLRKVVIIDKHPKIGGSCVNSSCLPAKYLLRSSQRYYDLKSGYLDSYGVITSKVDLNICQLMDSKSKRIHKLNCYLEDLIENKGITIIKGEAKFQDNHTLYVKGKKTEVEVKAENILIATGSKRRKLPGIKVDEKTIITSATAVNMMTVPNRLFIIGVGAKAIEIGCIWSRFGSDVTLFTNESAILGPQMDKQVCTKYQEILEQQGLKFVLNTNISGAKKCDSIVKLQVEDSSGNNKKEIECDVLLVAISDDPDADSTDLEQAGVEKDDCGAISINDNCQTSEAHIFAAGDVTPGPMSAHKAIAQGIVAVDAICGKENNLDWDNIPLYVGTNPEASSVGKTEEDLKKEGVPYKVKWMTLDACARAWIDENRHGCLKALICSETNRVLGTHLVCLRAAEIINEAILVQQFGICAIDVKRTIHSHPTYAKMFKALYGV